MKLLSDKEFKEIKETIEMYKDKYNETLEDYYKAYKGHKTIRIAKNNLLLRGYSN